MSHDIETLTFAAGDLLIVPGSAADNAFVVVSGSVCVEDDADTPLIVGPGEMVGDIDLMLGQTHSTAVVALEPVSAVRLTRIQLASALRSAPRVSAADMREMFAGLARRIAEHALANPAALMTNVVAQAPPQWQAILLTADGSELARQVGTQRLARSALPITVGRRPGRRESAPRTPVDIVLRDDKPYNMSRRHFAIDIRDGAAVVRDAGSLLGTIVNDVRIGAGRASATAPLDPGANLVVAGTSDSPFRFRLVVETD